MAATIAILGGNGFIGRALSLKLAAAGFRVLIISRQPHRVRLSHPAIFAQSYTDPLPSCQAAVNLAGASIAALPLTRGRLEIIKSSRLHSVQWLRSRISSDCQVLQASATGIYAPGQDCGENAVLAEGIYADICRAVEHEALSCGASHAPAILRIGVVIGHGGGLCRITGRLPPFRLAGAAGLGFLPWISLSDCADAICFIITRRLHGIFNLVSPQILTCNEVLRMSRPTVLPVLPLPAWLLRPDRRSHLLTFDCRIHPEALLKAGYHFAGS